MHHQIQWTSVCSKTDHFASVEAFSAETARRTRQFHRSFPQYRETSLKPLSGLAWHWKVGGIFVKDESERFGLNAFKVLGGSYAIGRYLADLCGLPLESLQYSQIISKEVKNKIGEITFVTATDGNHGRGVAWTAAQLGQKSVVYMPKGSSLTRLDHIRELGSAAEILDCSYDDCVRRAAMQAKQNEWILVQDTSFPGYEEIPNWIMQGYTTMALEADEQMERIGERPTHIFLQAGVGSMAAAVVAYFVSKYGKEIQFFVVEPKTADCMFRSAQEPDGKAHCITQQMNTIMAGLACGEPNPAAWKILKSYSSTFFSCPDWVSANGMRILAAPVKGDEPIISGESAAVGIGLLEELMQNRQWGTFRKKIGLNEHSKILFFSTEGNTDPQRYQDIVWHGAFHRPNNFTK